jgi:Zn-dependent peptidase ImmA (M78 family)
MSKPKLQRSREAEILELSEDVANEDCDSGKVCPTRICKAKGIGLIHNRYGKDKFDGMLVYRRSKWVILCNLDNGNERGSTRERFTISHELGHYHIPEHRRQLMAGCRSHPSKAGIFDGAASVEELEADTFAANLLMPPGRFVPKLRRLRKPPLRSINELRREFDTSLESTAIQSMRHDPRITAMAKWDNNELAWHRIAEVYFKERGYRQFLLRDCSQLPADSATAEAIADADTQYPSVIRETVSRASDCFGYVSNEGNRNIVFREESVRNGRFGVVTIYSELELP